MKRGVVFGLLGVSVLSIAWLLLRDPQPAAPAPAPTLAAPPSAAPSASHVLTYTLRYDSRMQASPWSDALPNTRGPRTLDATLELDADLEVRVTKRAGGSRLAVTLTSLRSAQLRALNQAAFADLEDARAALLGTTLRATRNETGVIDAFYDAPQANLIASNVLQALAQEWSISADPSAAAHVQPLPFGRARVAYARTGDALLRKITGYDVLRALPHDLVGVSVQTGGEDAGRLSALGNLAELQGRHTLLAKRNDQTLVEGERSIALHLTAERSVPAEPFDAAAYLARAPDSAFTSQELARRLLEARVDGLSAAELLGLLEQYGATGRFPEHARTVWRASALIELDPNVARALRALFLAANANDHARALILDLLVSAGTPEAQAVVRELLASEAARAEPRYATLYQRLGFVEDPDPETRAMAVKVYQDAKSGDDSNLATASLYTLGAVAGASQAAGPAATAPLLTLLHGALTASRSPDALEQAINAYANAREPSTPETLARHARHAEPKVRASVARALELTPTESGARMLVDLLEDDNVSVQRAALTSLRAHGLHPGAFDTLSRLARSGALHPSNQRVVLDLVKHSSQAHPKLTRSFLEAFTQGGIADPQVRSVVATWLARL